MKSLTRILPLACLLSLFSCAGKYTQKPLIGTLTDARDHFNTGAQGDEHTFVSFSTMVANLPVGLVVNRNRFFYLAINARDLAPYAEKQIKVEGYVDIGHRLIFPVNIWVQSGEKWEPISLTAPSSRK